MDTPQVAHKHENVTISMVALSWLGLVLMLWGIVCAFRFYICGAVLAAIGAMSYIKLLERFKFQQP